MYFSSDFFKILIQLNKKVANYKKLLNSIKNKIPFVFIDMKRSEVGDPTPEGSLTLVSNLLWVVVNRGLDILGNLTKLNITKY